MNDLTAYNSLRGRVKGGCVFFQGTGFLSDAITLFSGGKGLGYAPTHIAMIVPSQVVSSPDILITESTITGSGKATVDGPQINNLSGRAATYDPKGRIWVCEFTERILEMLNWPAVWSLMRAKVGTDHYNKLELGADALAAIPFSGRLGEIGYDNSEEVCSEYVLELLSAGGLVSVLRKQMPAPYGSSPSKVAPLPIFASSVQISGAAGALRGFSAAAYQG